MYNNTIRTAIGILRSYDPLFSSVVLGKNTCNLSQQDSIMAHV